jgi:hypothetical protein
MIERLAPLIRHWTRRAHETLNGSPESPDAPSPRTSPETPTDTKSVPRPEADVSKAEVFERTGLTPTAYVKAILESEGGQLRQQGVCETTGWTESTVSRTLSEIEEAGRIVRLRLGRQKMVYLPAEAPDHRVSDSPVGSV